MKVSLNEIFIPSNKSDTYAKSELYHLSIRKEFIQTISEQLDLTFREIPNPENNVCYSDNENLRPEYRSSFDRGELLELILCQIVEDPVHIQAEEVLIPNDSATFFSEAYKEKIIIRAQKRHLRRTMLTKRDSMPRKERHAQSQIICQKVWGLIENHNARVIHSFLPMGSEIMVGSLLQKALDHEIKVVVPKTLKKRQMQNLVLKDLGDMEQGIFNTYHPRNAVEYSGNYDLIIVAGLAFDSRGFRVGYGGGYYDTFLATQTNAIKAGICYSFQMVDQVPTEEHDIRLDCVLTD